MSTNIITLFFNCMNESIDLTVIIRQNNFHDVRCNIILDVITTIYLNCLQLSIVIQIIAISFNFYLFFQFCLIIKPYYKCLPRKILTKMFGQRITKFARMFIIMCTANVKNIESKQKVPVSVCICHYLHLLIIIASLIKQLCTCRKNIVA